METARKNEFFSINDIREKELALLGLTRKDIETLPPRTYSALMSGRRTSVIKFKKLNIPGINTEGASLDAKISLLRNPDGSARIAFHPINRMAVNSFNLSQQEEDSLKSGKEAFVEKKMNGKDMLVAFDKQVNEYVAIDKSKVDVPEEINGIRLSEMQKKNFREGNEIEVGGKKFRMDLNDELKVSSKEDNGYNLNSIKFKHSSYGKKEMYIDLALLVTGFPLVILIEHLLDILITTRKANKKDELAKLINENEKLKKSLASIDKETAKKVEKGGFLTPQEVEMLIEQHLNKNVTLHTMKDVKADEAIITPYPSGVVATVENSEASKSQAVKSNTTPVKNEKNDFGEEKSNTIKPKQQAAKNKPVFKR